MVVDHNGGEMLSNCLSSILENTSGLLEIIVVDNGSTNEKFETVYSIYKSNSKIRWIRTGSNFPLGYAKCVGGRTSKGKYVVYLDNDTLVTPSWLDPLIQCLEDNPAVGAAQSLLMTMENEIQHSGGIINSLGMGFSTHSIGLYAPKPDLHPMKVFFAAGAGMAIPRDFLWDIGFFDSHITFTDDIDLSWRINLSGREVLVCPRSIVVHLGGRTSVSSEAIKLRRQRYFSYELLHVSTKNYSAKCLAINLPKMSMLFGLMFAQRLRSRKPKEALSYLAGILKYLKTYPQVWKERTFVQQRIRMVSDGDLEKKMLLVDWPEMTKFAFSLLGAKKPIGPIGKPPTHLEK